ncbi:MAG TPA: ABC transporter permease [Candidatus Limnocylindria bacterium]|nr:ABC transporter permease [Candidatus Limnocylindria bacterium]
MSGRVAGDRLAAGPGPGAGPGTGAGPGPRVRPAATLRAIAVLTTLELRLTARRGENVLVTLVIPVAVLLFFAGTSLIPGDRDAVVSYLLPGSIALAIIAGGLVNLGIATGYERSYGVLKRLGGAPLPRWGLIAAKVAAVLVLAVIQACILIAVASLVLDWRPGAGWSPLLLVIAIVLGTLAFAGLGLLLAGTVRAEATLALANLLFLAFLMLGGIVLPVDRLPSLIQPVAAILPATALADLLRAALGTSGGAGATPSSPLVPALVVLGWGTAASALAARWFRWD